MSLGNVKKNPTRREYIMYKLFKKCLRNKQGRATIIMI